MKSKSSQGNSSHFLSLRRRLDAMGYSDLPLGIDSAPLVQQMLEDLVATTESLKDIEDSYQKTKEDLNLAETQIEPLQNENVRLTRENTQLHQRLISSKEELVKLENQNTINSFELQAENRRLKLVNQKANEQVKDLEKKLEQSKAKLQEVSEAPSITNIADVGEKDPRKVRRSIRSHRTGSSSINFDAFSNASAAAENEIKILNEKLETQILEINQKDKEISDLNHKIDEKNSLMQIRDEEILRLGSELQRETGKNGYIISLRHKFAQQEVEIEKLRAQVRVINSPTSPRVRRFYRIPPKAIIHISPSNNGEGSVFAPSVNDNFINENKTSSYVSSPSSTTNDNVKSNYNELVKEEVIPVEPIFTPNTNKPKEITAQPSFVTLRKNEKIEKYKNKINQLKIEISNYQNLIEKKESNIAKISIDLSYIIDNFESIIKEKDQLIEFYKSNPKIIEKEVIKNEIKRSNSKELELLNTISNLEHQIKLLNKEKLEEIEKLNDEISILRIPKPLPPCENCNKFKLQVQELNEQIKKINIEKVNLNENQSRISQLEKLVEIFENEKNTYYQSQEDTILLHSQMIKKEQENEKLRIQIDEFKKEMTSLNQRLNDSENKNNSVFELEQKFKSSLERIKAENNAFSKELKFKSSEYQLLNDKYIESQKLIREFQNELYKLKERSKLNEEEAKFHRGKSEEVQQILGDKLVNLQQGSTSTITQLQQQLVEKNKELKIIQKLLSDTRRQLAPLNEITIPQLKDQISKLQREKMEISNRVNSICQLAQFTEKNLDINPESITLVSALHQLQDQLKPFIKNI